MIDGLYSIMHVGYAFYLKVAMMGNTEKLYVKYGGVV